jgi:CHAD domain-containing protein
MKGWASGDRKTATGRRRKSETGFVKRDILQRVYGTRRPQDLETFTASVAAGSVRDRLAGAVRLVFFDTFDWRLYRRGWVLVQDGASLHLCDRRSGLELARQRCPDSPFRFAWDLVPGELRDYLAKALKVRALLHLVTVVGDARCDQYRDPETRRVWRLTYGDLKLVRHGRELPFLHTVSLEPVDGRDRGGKRLARLAASNGLVALPSTLLEPALARARLQPAAYSNRMRVTLAADTEAGAAIVRIATSLLASLNANRKGLEQDIDSEFLHDFRVAVRRTRCLLKLGKKVLPKDLRQEFGPRFARLGQATGALRDLDVYLLQGARYQALVPTELQAGLAEITERSAELRALRRAELDQRLAEPEFLAVLAAWGDVLAEGTAPWQRSVKKTSLTTEAFADRQVAATYARVLKCSTLARKDLNDRNLHRLRIACKEHRYTLEFFASLYARPALTALLSPLKQTQDVLGEHNDLVAHADHLRRLQAADGTSALTPAAAAAAEHLSQRLTEAKGELRQRFESMYSVLTSAKTRKRVRKMTGIPPS